MKVQIDEIKKEIELSEIQNTEALEAFRIKYLSKKGLVTNLFDQLKNIPAEDRKLFGKDLNDLKNLAQTKFENSQTNIESGSEKQIKPNFDLTLPTTPNAAGTIHPISIVKRRIIEIFERMGFNIAEGPEIETDWYNFSALNFPDNHPAREMQDTFFYRKK